MHVQAQLERLLVFRKPRQFVRPFSQRLHQRPEQQPAAAPASSYLLRTITAALFMRLDAQIRGGCSPTAHRTAAMFFQQQGGGQRSTLVQLLLLLLAATGPTSSQAPPGSAEAAASEAAAQQHGTPVGSMLRQYEQCGGAGGLCNQTTIGVPCGDHVWRGIVCPEAFSCQRQNSSAWLCLPAPPGSPEASRAASRNSSSSSSAENNTASGSRSITPEAPAATTEIINENAAQGAPGPPGAARSSAATVAGCVWRLTVQTAAAVAAAVSLGQAL